MKFKVIMKDKSEKIIEARNLETAERKAGKKWIEIILIDKTKGREIY